MTEVKKNMGIESLTNRNFKYIHIQGGPYITANLYCISLSEHETCAQGDAVQINGNI